MILTNSLRFRLLGAAVCVIIVALLLAGGALFVLFERHVTRALDAELEGALDQLAALLAHDASGALYLVSEPADPRTRRPLGGRYWQVSQAGLPVLRSRSLWDTALKVPPADDPAAGVRRLNLPGPEHQTLYVLTRAVILEPSGGSHGEAAYTLAVATDAAEVRQRTTAFASDLASALGILGALLVLASWVQVKVGLAPFESMRRGIERVRLGETRRLEPGLPTELQPLIAETNRLLEEQERAIEAARGRAGDLAHGLKTPLTALAVLLDKLRAKGMEGLAGDCERQLNIIGRHVERELARARIAGSGVVRQTRLLPVIEGLLETMDKLPRGTELAWSVDCDASLVAPAEEADLTETLGNLLDNARKWARSSVRLQARREGDCVEIAVDDDGPGVPAEDHERVLQRGMRLDESRPGTGLGLTIVKDIAEAYGATVALTTSDLGGLSVRLSFFARKRPA